MTTMRMPPINARFSTALCPPVRAWVRAVMTNAPRAGPHQWRVPPSAAIMIASTASPIANVSSTVT